MFDPACATLTWLAQSQGIADRIVPIVASASGCDDPRTGTLVQRRARTVGVARRRSLASSARWPRRSRSNAGSSPKSPRRHQETTRERVSASAFTGTSPCTVACEQGPRFLWSSVVQLSGSVARQADALRCGRLSAWHEAAFRRESVSASPLSTACGSAKILAT